MLKTLSTESAEPRKGEVGVGGGGRNRAEPVGKHELDGVDDGGGCNGDFDKKFHPRLYTIAASLTLMLKTSSSTDSSASAAQIVVEFDGVDAGGRAVGKLVKKLSKSCQKVQKASRVWKHDKDHRFGGTFTEAPILRRRTRASVRALTVFWALFARPRSSFDTTFGAIINRAQLIELLMLFQLLTKHS